MLFLAVFTVGLIYYTAQTTVYLAMRMGVKMFISSVTGSAEVASKVAATLPRINLGSILDIGTLIVHGIDVFKSGKARISFTLHVFTRICVAAGYHTIAFTFLKERVMPYDGEEDADTKTFISRLGGLLFEAPSREALHRLQYFNAQALAAKNITAMLKLLYQFIEWYRSYDPSLDKLRAQYEEYMNDTAALLGVDVMKIPMAERPRWKELHERGLLLRANLALARPSLGKTVPAAFLANMTQFENTLHNMEAVMKSWEPRMKPVTVLLRGPGGTGKTTLSAALMNYARKLSHPDLTLEEAGCFTYDYGKNVNARMDGVTHHHTLIHMNDMLQQTDAVETAKEVQLINNIADTPPFFPDVAFMHAKRMATTRPDFLFITTNKSLHDTTPNLGIEDPFALIRRPDFDIEMPDRVPLERQPVVSKGELGRIIWRHERGHKRNQTIPVAKLMLMMKQLFIERKRDIGNYFQDAENELNALVDQMKDFEHEEKTFDVIEKMTETQSRRLDSLENVHQESLYGTRFPEVENESKGVKALRLKSAEARRTSIYSLGDPLTLDELQYMRQVRVNEELEDTVKRIKSVAESKPRVADLITQHFKSDESSSAPLDPVIPHAKICLGTTLYHWDWRDETFRDILMTKNLGPNHTEKLMQEFNRVAHHEVGRYVPYSLIERYAPMVRWIERNTQVGLNQTLPYMDPSPFRYAEGMFAGEFNPYEDENMYFGEFDPDQWFIDVADSEPFYVVRKPQRMCTDQEAYEALEEAPVTPHVNYGNRFEEEEEAEAERKCCFIFVTVLMRRNAGKLAAFLLWFLGRRQRRFREMIIPHNGVRYVQDHFYRLPDHPDYAVHRISGRVVNVANQKYIVYEGERYHFRRGIRDEWTDCPPNLRVPILTFPGPTGPSATNEDQELEDEPDLWHRFNAGQAPEWFNSLFVFLFQLVVSFCFNGTLTWFIGWAYYAAGWSTAWTRIWMICYLMYLTVATLIAVESTPQSSQRQKDYAMLGVVVATALIIIIVWWSHRREKVTKKKLFKDLCFGNSEQRREAYIQMSKIVSQNELDDIRILTGWISSIHHKIDWIPPGEIAELNAILRKYGDMTDGIDAKDVAYPVEEMKSYAQKPFLRNRAGTIDPDVRAALEVVEKLQAARAEVKGEIYTARERIKAKKNRIAAVKGEAVVDGEETLESLEEALSDLETKEIKIKADIYAARERLKTFKKNSEMRVIPHIATDANAISVIESISANIMNIIVRTEHKEDIDTAQATGIGGRDVLINKHTLLALQRPKITVIFRGSVTEYAFAGKELEELLKSAQVFDNDRVVITHSKFPQFHDIHKHFRDDFPTQTTFIPNKLICIFRDFKGKIIQRESNPSTGFMYSPESRNLEGTDVRLAGFYRVLIETYPSMSGAIFVECNPHAGKKIIGTLCGGLTPGESVVVPLVKGEFFHTVNPYMSAEMFKKLSGIELKYDPEEAEYREMLLNGEPPGWHYYGQAKEAVPYCSTNKIQPTPLQRVITPTTAPNHCEPFKVDGKIRYPETLFMTSGVATSHPVDSAILDRDLQEMVHRMPAPNRTRVPNSVLSDHDALNGIPGTMLHEVPLDTSPGYRLRKVCGQGKIPYFKTIDVAGKKVTILSDRARREIAECIEVLKTGPIPVVMMVKNKNERYSKEKVDKKSRGVSADDARNLFILRKYLGPFLESLRRYMPYGSSAVGINADSHLWDEMFTYLASNASPEDIQNDTVKAMALDGAKWEFKYPYEVKCCFRKAAEQWFEIYYEVDPTSEEATIRSNLLRSYENYFMLLLDIVLVRVGGMTSGFGATAEENGFGNELMTRVCWRHIYPDLPYDDHVRAVFYGDDFLATVYNAPNFNQITFSEKAKELFGIDWLTDRKVPPTEDYIRLIDATFISRRFIRIPGTRIVMGSLEKTDIYEMALWARYSDEADAMIKFRNNCENSLQFMMAYGEQEYEVWRKIVNRELLRNKMPAIDVTYHDRVRHYLSKL